MPNYLRSCTDVVCLFILVLIVGAFVGLMIYAFIAGEALSVIAIYNSNQVRCNNRTDAFTCTFCSIKSGMLPPASLVSVLPVALPPRSLGSLAWPTELAVLRRRLGPPRAPLRLTTPQLLYNLTAYLHP